LKGHIHFIIAMLIFGSIGVFVKNINLSSSEIAFLRGVIGCIFLVGLSFLIKQRPSFKAIKENFLLLILSGAAIGFNWIFLFESYHYTTVSNATVCYYFAPIFVMVLAPIILKEKITPVKVICIIAAMVGLLLIAKSGTSINSESYQHSVGIMYGLLAAALYASVILMNKFIINLTGFETTLVQLMTGVLVLFPYVLVKDHMNFSGVNAQSILFILIVGIIHTGIAYFFYFSSLKSLKGQTIAVLSYIDPIFAVLLAALLLGESMSFIQIMGGIFILGSTYLSERLEFKRYTNSKNAVS
jgi:RarD protein